MPIGERALVWLEKYRLETRPELVTGHDGGTLFLSDAGRPFRRNALTLRVKRYLDEAGIEKEGACHLFRHAMATHMLERGADIRFIQAMLGHADLNTTQIYTRVSIEKLKAVHAATHPAKARRDAKPCMDEAGQDGETGQDVREALFTTLADEVDDELSETPK